ncbi:hypothetical protein PRVXT_000742 [Proteinivorax tanatarense]|uniref:Membrane protein YesL n=1 Tax=Proteinivorax tanatarense TaxID=1260629 RepID=A0AAU7VNG3_9FIRM
MKKLLIFKNIKRGFSIAVENIGLLISCFVIALLASLITGVVYEMFALGFVFSIVLTTVFEVGLINVSLKAVRSKEKPEFKDLFSKIELIGAVIVANIFILGITLGLLTGMLGLAELTMTISPIITLALGVLILGLVVYIVIGFVFATYVIVDKEKGPIDAIKKSWKIISKVRIRLFALFALLVLINLLGLLAFIVGIFITVPATFVILALTYLDLYEQTYNSEAI